MAVSLKDLYKRLTSGDREENPLMRAINTRRANFRSYGDNLRAGYQNLASPGRLNRFKASVNSLAQQPITRTPGVRFIEKGANLINTPLGAPARFIQGRGQETADLARGSIREFRKGNIGGGLLRGGGAALSVTPPSLANLGLSGAIGYATAPKGSDRLKAAGRSSAYGSIAQGFSEITNPQISRLLPKGSSVVASRALPGLANVAQGIGIDRAAGLPTTPGSVALDLGLGLIGKQGQFGGSAIKRNFSLDTKTFDELIRAEDMIKNPKNYIGKISTGERTQKQALKRIQERGVEVVERLSAKYLPDVKINNLKTVEAKIRALVDLSSQNKLANVPGMELVGSSKKPPSPTGKVAQPPKGDIETKIERLLNVARERMAKADVANQGLKPAEVDWLYKDERALLNKLQSELPRIGKDEALTRVNIKRELSKRGISFNPDDSLENLQKLISTPQPPKGDIKIKPSEEVKIKGGNLQQQTRKIPTTPQEVQAEVKKALPESQVISVQDKGGGSSKPIITRNKKYAFNINKPKLGLEGKDAQKLDEVVDKMKPILEARRGKPLTNDEIIKGGRKAVMLDEVIGRDEAADFSKKLQATRNFVRTASKEKGVTPEYLAQLEILSSTAADTGRKLRSFAVNAEDSGIKEAILVDLKKLGIETKRLIDAGKNVDWEDASQVTAFYRKFKPADFLEKLQEYRYVNMLSSPNTQIVNTFGNLLQGGLVTPAEYTIRGGLDFARSRLTGTEQKYFASQGVDYAKGFWKSLPEAWNNFSKVVKGEGGLLKPDIEFIPTSTSRLHKAYTTPLRLLEASDQFFRTMISGGEKASLAKSGLSEAELLKQAELSANYRTFRQAFDPEGKLGQGDFLKIWDKWNSGINHLRRLPGGKWIVPFLQTPTNILKQGVEYSPLGVLTVKGSKEPIEQLSKTFLGSGVFVGAYALAEAGLTTWDAPANYKDRQKFYDAGLQPYSIKIGDKWYSYSKLGPISYPIAMAAAMKWAKDNGAENDFLTTLGVGMGGFLQFFADQSYMQGIGDVIDAVRGDEFKQGRALANIPSQMIPYRALQGWVARLVDPIYRKSTGGGIGEQAIKSIKTQVPFVSKTLEPYTNLSGEPSRRSFPLINAFSPIKISEQKKDISPTITTKSKDLIIENQELPSTTEELSVLYKDALRITGNYAENKTKAQYGLVDKTLEEYQAEVDQAIKLKKQIEAQYPEKVFDIQLDTYSKNGSATTEERIKWASDQLIKAKDRESMLEQLYKGQVLTKSVVEALNEQYDLGLTKYNYGSGFRYLSGSGKKGRKITVSKLKLSPIKLSRGSAPKISFNPPARPKIASSKPVKVTKSPTISLPEYKPNISIRWL